MGEQLARHFFWQQILILGGKTVSLGTMRTRLLHAVFVSPMQPQFGSETEAQTWQTIASLVICLNKV